MSDDNNVVVDEEIVETPIEEVEATDDAVVATPADDVADEEEVEAEDAEDEDEDEDEEEATEEVA